MADSELDPEPRSRPSRAVFVHVLAGRTRAAETRHPVAFTIGSAAEADVQLLEPGVAPVHAEVLPDGILWWVRDLSGAAGTFVDGRRAHMVPLRESARVRLGPEGPELRLELVDPRIAPTAAPEEATDRDEPGPEAAAQSARSAGQGGFTSETQILRRFLGKKGAGPEGRETVMFRRAFERVRKRSALPYQLLALAVLLALAAAGGVILHQQRKLRALRGTAERLFYATRAMDVQISQLEEVVLASADRKALGDLLARKARFSQMEAEYDSFVKELGVYAKVPEDEQVILRTARAFGECEVNVPPEFVDEVRRYVQRWKTSDLLAKALRRSAEAGYGGAIQRVLFESGLPRQFVYLPLVESGYDARAVGPTTRYGHAKGMWQFIAPTAANFGLRVGPLYDRPEYDPQDERFDWQKATTAAVRYIRELSGTDAQGSGMLVMACYNWGEAKVQAAIARLPPTPQDRNFWRLLRDRAVPRETYDYVLSIFSAAVICENPKLFGFELTCPAMQAVPAEPAAAR